jgi:GTPase SAR1 family protein
MSVPLIKPAKGMRSFEFKQSRYKHLAGMNCLRSIVSGASGSGKTLLVQAMLMDIFAQTYERAFIFSPTIHSDHTWEPVKAFLRKTKKIPEEEELFFETFDVEKLKRTLDIITRLFTRFS